MCRLTVSKSNAHTSVTVLTVSTLFAVTRHILGGQAMFVFLQHDISLVAEKYLLIEYA